MLRTISRLALFAIAPALLVTLLLGAGTAAAQTTVNVSLLDPVVSEFDLIASPTSAPEGSVTFDVSNDGGIVHNFLVIASDLSPGGLPIDQSTNQVDVTQVNVLDQTPDIPGGGSDSLTLDMTAGNYVLICNVPGHYGAGMYSGFQVTGGQQPTATATTQPPGGATATPGVTPSPTTGVSGLAETGQGPEDGSSGALWLLAAMAAAGAALIGLGAFAARRSL